MINRRIMEDSEFWHIINKYLSVRNHVWFMGYMPEESKHGAEPKVLVKDFIAILEEKPKVVQSYSCLSR